ncbi:ATPase component of Mn/Zn ABC-type transporter [Corynebacterium mustelae]|uniref:ATPase component of Mn/Zn ABC-type transporter n=1 Tax=Corynebacterium mustelae TaxID=571915 RepID=A0A0G3H7E9_9CORY|nr:ATP-binding cassette domain-containing protein [Corynebacterium mustelae]AKK07092.1 ATPase component of Mn/Zn ABC-type transporter [Corynebacterium mustelae]
MAQPVIAAHNIAVGYGGPPIIRDVTFDLHPSEALALIGANGSGKSTLLKGITGLSEVRGQLTITGTVGYVPQHQDIDPSFPATARGVVEMGLYPNTPWWRRIPKEPVTAAIDAVGLREIQHTRFGDLSGGQRQRILIARALVTKPHVLLLDEPFNGLDPQSRTELVLTIRNLIAGGTSLIIATHDYSLAHDTCQRCAIVADGTITVLDTKEALADYGQ